MFTGQEIVAILRDAQISHVVWVPDSTLGAWESALENASGITLVRVCREGEAWPLAAGLLMGGARPLIMMQCTGLFESGDALRNVVYDLRQPVFALIGARNWLHPDSRDSARRFAEPVLKAWQVDYRWIASEADKPALAAHYRQCRQHGVAGAVLMAEGKG
jgi:sulfopyruvate decarboxylase subunit alpha